MFIKGLLIGALAMAVCGAAYSALTDDVQPKRVYVKLDGCFYYKEAGNWYSVKADCERMSPYLP